MKKAPWIVLTSVFAVLTAACVVGHLAILPSFDAQLRATLKPKLYEVVETGDGSEDTQYFKSEFNSIQELNEAENELCTNLEAEGAVLLKNNGVLPFKNTDKFSLFSTSSVDPIYGGTGSGQVSANDAVNLRKAMNTEFEGGTNTTLFRHYLSNLSDYRRVNAGTTGGTIDQYRINEAPWAEVMTDDIKETLPDYPNAIVVLARSGGEGNDLPITQCGDGTDGNYLVLNQNEKDMLLGLKQLKDQGKLSKIVVLLNGSNALQLDFLFDEAYGIDGAVWIGGVGTTGMTAVAELLSGKRNFSGRLSDTFLKNNLSSPSIVNFGLQAYTNSSAGTGEYTTGWVQYNAMGSAATNRCNENYIVYQEGIYIGYRYYETRYADFVMGQGNTAGYDYSVDVAYPFGYGLSYTTFAYSNFNIEDKGDHFDATVTVTNNGEVSGKHAVEIYVSSEFTDYDKQHNIEKSAIQLGGFTKTGIIEPHKSETVSVTIRKRDIASYDVEGAATYILDGNYYFTAGENAHAANNNVLTYLGHGGACDKAGDSNLVKAWNAGALDKETCAKSPYTGAAITNAFDHADLNRYEGTKDQKITYLSRKDWKGTFPATNVKLSINDTMWADGLTDDNAARDRIAEKMINEHYADWKDAELPAIGVDGALRSIMFRTNDDIDSDGWNDLISQIPYGTMTDFIYNGFHVTKEIAAIQLPNTKDENGPQGYTASLTEGGDGAHGMAYTSEDVMAATRNVDLLHRMGQCIGEDCLSANNAGLYGPGANIHRNPYCGRNFEYYSEDPVLSIAMQAPEVEGIQSKGVYVFTKHFALNDQESGRYGLGTWANEQSIRELYLRSFEGTAIAKGSGVMSSFNRLGVVWAGADYSLMTTVLREEFGLKGGAITDCSVFCGYMDHHLGILAGQDLWDGSGDSGTLDGRDNDPVVARCVQRAIKRMAYSITHSLAMNGISSTTELRMIEPWYYTLTRGLSIGFGAATGVSAGLIVLACII